MEHHLKQENDTSNLIQSHIKAYKQIFNGWNSINISNKKETVIVA